jgi:thiol-disulfide isomerase/thioredoxin
MRIIYFHSLDCAPCLKMDKALNEIQKTIPDLIIQKANIYQEWELVDQYKVMSLPTLIVPDAIKRLNGYQNYEQVLNFIKECLKCYMN